MKLRDDYVTGLLC